MINITIQNMLDSMSIFNELATQKLPARTAFKVNKLIKAISKEYESFEVARQQLIDTYGEKNEDGSFKTDENNNILVKVDKQNEFMRELEALVQTEIELNAPKLKFEEIEGTDFTPIQMGFIDCFLEED